MNNHILNPHSAPVFDNLQPAYGDTGATPMAPQYPCPDQGVSVQPPAPQPGRWANIPAELRERRQWCVAGADKSPRTITGQYASSTKPETWSDFDAACLAAAARGLHIGYMLHESDPFACIDLDVKDGTTQEQLDRFQKISGTLDSYTERSRSGRGLHVWVRGETGQGCHRDGVEVYSQERFIITTGDVLFDKPIVERQGLLNLMVTEIRSAQQAAEIELEELEEEEDDAAIVQRAIDADNGDKFNALCACTSCHGDGERKIHGSYIELGYQSQSEADLALMSIFTFYSQSNEQCRRLFRMSGLGQREKATKNDRYLNRTLKIIRGRQARESMQVAHGREIAEALSLRVRAPLSNRNSIGAGLGTQDEDSWVISVGDVLTNPSPPPEFLTSQLMPAGEVTLFAAHGGTGKSLLMLMWAVHATLGRRFLGRNVVQAPVIFYSGEDRADTVRFRLAKICEGFDCPPDIVAQLLTVVDATDDPVLFAERYNPEIGKYTTTTDTYDRLKRLGDKRGARYFFIDNASDTFDADEIKRSPVRQFLRALRALGLERGAGVMLAAHVDKQTARGSGGGQDYSGSTAWNNSVRSRLFLGAAADEDPGLILTQGKSNHGRIADPIQLYWNEDGLLEMTSSEEAEQVRGLMDDVHTAELLRIIELLTAERINVPTATSGPATTFHALRAHSLFPAGMNAKQTNALILKAEIAKKIRRDEYVTSQRKHGTRWVLA